MRPLTVLVTNLVLSGRSGTECYVRDLAGGLARGGHRPVVYSPRLGPIADELRTAGVEVVDGLARLTVRPDVIHGHHNLPTMEALLALDGVPALFVCHDSRAWHDAPPRFPRIRRYVAVDDACHDRLAAAGIPPESIEVVLNFVDLDRFRPRGPLPGRPRRALLFSHYASEATHLPGVREACRAAGVELDVIGAAAGRSHPRPETILGEYDLVFAKARCALEAMAVGAAVVVCDAEGVGGMVVPARFDEMRRLNFGRRTLRRPLGAAILGEEIARYDPGAAAAVAARLRAAAGLGDAVDRLVDLYRAVAAGPGAPAAAAEREAASAFLRLLEPQLNRCFYCVDGSLRAEAELAAARARGAELAGALAAALARGAELEAVRAREAELAGALAAAQARVTELAARTPWRRARQAVAARLPPRARVWVRRALRRAPTPEDGTTPGREPPIAPVVVGVPRSGTTLVRMILDAHPHLAVPPETGFLPALAELRRRPAPATLDQLLGAITGSPNWVDFHLREADLRRALRLLPPSGPGDAARAFYRLYAARFGKPRWGDKTPAYLTLMREIEDLLPEACFVHVIRDGRDVAVSVRPLWFAPSRDVAALAADWRDRIREGRRQAAHVRRYAEIRYEELVRDPAPAARRLCALLDLPWDDGMLRFHERAPARLAEHEARVDAGGRVWLTREARRLQQAMVAQPPTPARIGRWRFELSADDQARFAAVAGDLLAELGYEV